MSPYSIGRLEQPEDPEDEDFFNNVGQKMVEEIVEQFSAPIDRSGLTSL